MRIYPEYMEKEQLGQQVQVGYPEGGGRTRGVVRTDKAQWDRDYPAETSYRTSGHHGITWETPKGQSADREYQEQKRDYRILMAHIVSEEDYRRLTEEGFEPGELTPEETVTIVDRIKLDMIRGGARIRGYTDQLPTQVLEELLGDEGLALEVERALREADLPCTEENIGEVCRAAAMAMSLRAPEDSEKALLLRRGERAEIETLYRMENSGSRKLDNRGPVYFAEEIEGYFSKNAAMEEEQPGGDSGLPAANSMVARTLEGWGEEVDEGLLQAADWLMKQGLEVRRDHLDQYQKIESIRFPLTRQDGIRAAVYALMEGKRAWEGDLSQTRSLYRQAIEMEETRLYMTAEVNLHLLRRGISLDTCSVEERIQLLEQSERELADVYFEENKGEEALARYRCMRTTLETIGKIRELPEDVLSVGREAIGEDNLPGLRRRGEAIRADYIRAGQEYEKLMTSPVKSLGDMPEKAFGDIDRLLGEVGWEQTEESRRDMRILVVSRMELTRDNLLAIRGARELTEAVIEKMTPGAVWRMIQEGENPLEKSLDELAAYLSYGEEEEPAGEVGYGDFLRALERRGNVTEEERGAYIGIHRLIHRLGREKDTAIGAMVEEKALPGLGSLLRAMRSEGSGGVDIQLGEGLTFPGRGEREGQSISEQIEGGFPLNHPAYREEEVLRILARGGRRQTAYAMQAAWGLLVAPFGLSKIKGQGQSPSLQEWRRAMDGLWEVLGDPEFEEEYEGILDRGREICEARKKEGNRIPELAGLEASYRQIELAGNLAGHQEFFFPMEGEEGAVGVHLRLQKAPGERSRVSVSLGWEEKGSLCEITGEIEIREGCVWASIGGNPSGDIRKLEKIADTFKDRVGSRWSMGALVVQRGTGAKDKGYWGSGIREEAGASARDLYGVAKIFLQSVQAVEAKDREDRSNENSV